MKSALILIFSIVLILSCKRPDQSSETLNAEPLPSTPKNIKVENQGVYIDHNIYGDGPYTLLFVHGWCIDQTYWSAQVEALSPTFRIVTVDMPGFGQSGTNREKWSIEAYGSDIQAVIEQLELKNVILIGHSMGGDVILEAALNHKEVIALIGVDNFKDVGIEFDEQTQAEIDGFLGMLKSNFVEITKAYAETTLFQPDTDSLVKSQVVESFTKSDSTIAIASLEGLLDYAKREFDQLSALKQKLYLINSNSTPTNREGLDAAGINYEVIDIAATSHYPMIEKPVTFNTLLKQILKKVKAEHNHKNNS